MIYYKQTDRFHLVYFQMYYLILLVQELLVIFETFINKFKEVRYNKKSVYEISLNFLELSMTGKCVKIRFKNSGHHGIFSVLEVKR